MKAKTVTLVADTAQTVLLESGSPARPFRVLRIKSDGADQVWYRIGTDAVAAAELNGDDCGWLPAVSCVDYPPVLGEIGASAEVIRVSLISAGTPKVVVEAC